jgi:peroxiredoxin
MTTKLRRPQTRRRRRRPTWPGRLAILLLAGVALYLFAPGLADWSQAITTGLPTREDGQAASTSSAEVGTLPARNSTAARSSETGPPDPRIGKVAPEIRVLDLEGRPLDLAELRGKVVLLNFWASWCKPCEAEMADLQALHTEQAARGFTVVGLNEGEEPGRAAAFLQAKGITFPTVLDLDMAVTRRYQVFGLPNTFLIDANGVIQDRTVGPLMLEQMRARVLKVLAGQTLERPRLTSIWAAMTVESENPAAEVYGQTITVGEVNRRVDLENALMLLRGGLPPDLSSDEGRTQIREQQRVTAERLVDERLIATHSRAVGLSIPDGEIAAGIERIAGEVNLDGAGLGRELAALGSDITLLVESQRAARLIGGFTLDYILTGRTPERVQDVQAWMAAAKGSAGVRIVLP